MTLSLHTTSGVVNIGELDSDEEIEIELDFNSGEFSYMWITPDQAQELIKHLQEQIDEL